MAWFDRVPGIRRVSNALRRITGRQPQPPPEAPPVERPRPVVQSTYELPSLPVQPAPAPVMGLPAEAPMQPTETGVWQPIAQQEVQPSGWQPIAVQEAPPPQTPTERLYELSGDEFTVYDPDRFFPVIAGHWEGETFIPDPFDQRPLMTRDDWYREALQPADYLRARYGWSDPNISRPNIEILRQLELDGYWIDWDQWRESYDAYVYG